MSDLDHDWFVDARAAYVLRALEPLEERAFVEHLLTCGECREAVIALQQTSGMLGAAVAPVALPAGFADRIVREVVGTSGVSDDAPSGGGSVNPTSAPSFTRRWLPFAAAATLAVAGGLGWWNARRDIDALQRAVLAREARLAANERALNALGDTLSLVRRAGRVVHTTVAMDNKPMGTVTILDDSVSHRWYVVVSGLPPAPPGERYTFWFVLPDGMVRGADVTPGPDGSVRLALGMPEGARAVLGAALTMEDSANVAGPPRGMEIAHLTLE